MIQSGASSQLTSALPTYPGQDIPILCLPSHSHLFPTNSSTEIQLLVVGFTESQPPPSVQVSFEDSIILSEEDLVDIERYHWIPANRYK